MAAWGKANRSRLNAKKRADYRRRPYYYIAATKKFLYGITAEEYRSHLIGQAGRCLVCLRVPEGPLAVDHDHATGRVRGLLCRNCNSAIGFLRDDPRLMHSAAAYIERSA